MSSILKALRKLEEEKAALGEGGVDIAHDILKGSAARSQRKLLWPLVSLVLLLLLLGSALFSWHLAAPPGSQALVVSSAPVATVPHASPAPSPTGAAPVAAPAPVAAARPAPRPFKPATLAAPVVSPPVVTAKPAQAPEPTALDTAGFPFLVLSGIAYRENPAERIAILNDLPVMQGTSIEGAEVVEILTDRVVLEWKGKRVEKRVDGQR